MHTPKKIQSIEQCNGSRHTETPGKDLAGTFDAMRSGPVAGGDSKKSPRIPGSSERSGSVSNPSDAGSQNDNTPSPLDGSSRRTLASLRRQSESGQSESGQKRPDSQAWEEVSMPPGDNEQQPFFGLGDPIEKLLSDDNDLLFPADDRESPPIPSYLKNEDLFADDSLRSITGGDSSLPQLTISEVMNADSAGLLTFIDHMDERSGQFLGSAPQLNDIIRLPTLSSEGGETVRAASKSATSDTTIQADKDNTVISSGLTYFPDKIKKIDTFSSHGDSALSSDMVDSKVLLQSTRGLPRNDFTDYNVQIKLKEIFRTVELKQIRINITTEIKGKSDLPFEEQEGRIIHRIHSHYSGEVPIHAVAAYLDPRSVLEIYYDRDYYLKEATRSSLYEGVDGPVGYQAFIDQRNNRESDKESHDVLHDLLLKGYNAAERMRDELITLGVDAKRVRIIYRERNQKVQTEVSRSHKIVAERFYADEGEESEALVNGICDQIPLDRQKDIEKAMHEHLSGLKLDQNYPVYVFWIRQSGLNLGGVYPELDTHPRILKQLMDFVKEKKGQCILIGDQPPSEWGKVFGDKPGTEWMDAYSPNLIKFWEQGRLTGLSDGLNRAEQAFALHLLNQKYDLRSVGMESGALEIPALSNITTVYLERSSMGDKGKHWEYVAGVDGLQPGPVSKWRRLSFAAANELQVFVDRFRRIVERIGDRETELNKSWSDFSEEEKYPLFQAVYMNVVEAIHATEYLRGDTNWENKQHITVFDALRHNWDAIRDALNDTLLNLQADLHVFFKDNEGVGIETPMSSSPSSDTNTSRSVGSSHFRVQLSETLARAGITFSSEEGIVIASNTASPSSSRILPRRRLSLEQLRRRDRGAADRGSFDLPHPFRRAQTQLAPVREVSTPRPGEGFLFDDDAAGESDTSSPQSSFHIPPPAHSSFPFKSGSGAPFEGRITRQTTESSFLAGSFGSNDFLREFNNLYELRKLHPASLSDTVGKLIEEFEGYEGSIKLSQDELALFGNIIESIENVAKKTAQDLKVSKLSIDTIEKQRRQRSRDYSEVSPQDLAKLGLAEVAPASKLDRAERLLGAVKQEDVTEKLISNLFEIHTILQEERKYRATSDQYKGIQGEFNTNLKNIGDTFGTEIEAMKDFGGIKYYTKRKKEEIKQAINRLIIMDSSRAHLLDQWLKLPGAEV